MKINIETIPHTQQRYPTIGDYWDSADGVQQIKVSDMKNEDYEFLVAIHELIEKHLCRKANIKEEDITNFDIAFEKNRENGNVDEPGNDPQAPYYIQHQFATAIEKEVARALGVDWEEYDKFVDLFN